MDLRVISVAVDDTGKAKIVRQWGGVQYEDNATEINFTFSFDLTDKVARIDFDSPEAGYDAGETVDIGAENKFSISRRIPYKYTRFGGEMTATLVTTYINNGNADGINISVPVPIYFTANERHEETEDFIALNVSAAELAALESAMIAEDAAEEANTAAARAEEAAKRAEGAGGGIPQEVLDAKQDKFAEVTADDEYGTDFSIRKSVYFGVDGSSFVVEGEGENTAIIFNSSGSNPVGMNGIYVFPAKNGRSVTSGFAMSDGDDSCAATKGYVDGIVGDIDSALDGVIAIQNALIGGDA